MLPKFYYERQRKRKQKIFWITGSVLLISVAILLFTFRSAPVKNVIKPVNQPTLGSEATLELTTLYSCGHSATRLLPLPEELIGKSQEETNLLYPKWKILNFNETFLVAEEIEATECDNHFLLFLQNDSIIVTASKDKSKLITKQKINPNILTNEDKEILTAGIFISSEYELLEILESFQ